MPMETRYGVVASDIDVSYTMSGVAVANLTVRGASGRFVKLVAFGDMAEDMFDKVTINEEISVTGYFKDYEYRGEITTKFVVKEWRSRK